MVIATIGAASHVAMVGSLRRVVPEGDLQRAGHRAEDDQQVESVPAQERR